MIKKRHQDMKKGCRTGFTLIEVLTAIVVVAMITIGCATMFNQATESVTAGTRRAEWNILGRSLVHLIASELGDAVFMPNAAPFDFTIVPPDGSGNVTELSFVRFRNDWEEDSAGIRAAIRITYKLLPDSTVERKTEWLIEGENYPDEPDWVGKSTNAIGRNIYSLVMVPDPDWIAKPDGLPRYMDIYVDLVSESDIVIYESQTGNLPEQGSQWVLDNAMTYQSRAYFRNRNRYE